MSTEIQLEFTAEVFGEGENYVAQCPELSVSSTGTSPDEAKRALQEAVAAFVERCQELGTLESVLQEAGFSYHSGRWISPAFM